MNDRDHVKMYWAIRRRSIGNRKPVPLSKETWRLWRLFKRSEKLRQLKKKLRVP